MKQYCRYCSHCSYGDVAYCNKLERIMSEEKAKRINRCKDFEFLEVDVFNLDRIYKERQKKEDGQMSIFDFVEKGEQEKNGTK